MSTIFIFLLVWFYKCNSDALLNVLSALLKYWSAAVFTTSVVGYTNHLIEHAPVSEMFSVFQQCFDGCANSCERKYCHRLLMSVREQRQLLVEEPITQFDMAFVMGNNLMVDYCVINIDLSYAVAVINKNLMC